MYSDNLVIKLNSIAQDYRQIILQSLKDILSQDKYRNTGAGVNSLQVDVINGDKNKCPQIIVTFDDHLLYLDKRKIQWTKLPEIKGLLAWAETKTTTEGAAKQLAWATAWDKKKHDTWKPKPWRRKGLSSALKEMNKMILDGFQKAIEEDMVTTIKTAV